MEFKTKTEQAFNASFEVAGPLVPISTQAPVQEDWEDPLTQGMTFDEDADMEAAKELIANRLAHREGLNPTVKELARAYREFDEEYPAIAELVQQHQAFLAKRKRVIDGIKGQVKIAAASLMATAVVITGLGFVSRTAPDVVEEPVQEECMIRSDFSEGYECIH